MDLSIDKTDNPDPVQEGQRLTYTLTVENQGPLVATGVEARDQLDPRVNFESASAGCTYRGDTHTVICRASLLELLLPGQTKTWRIHVRPDPAEFSTTTLIMNVACVEGHQSDFDEGPCSREEPDDEEEATEDPDPEDNLDVEFTTVLGVDGGNGNGGNGDGPAECDGEPATISEPTNGHFHGTEGDDVIVGTDGNDVIHGHGGNDRLCGEGGNDTVLGHAGFDRIFGGLGDDLTLDGGNDSDFIEGQGGSDDGSGGGSPDLLLGGSGNDDLRGESGRDGIAGEDGDDDLFGDEENDALVGNAGDDFADGGSGNADFCRAEREVRCER